MFRFHLPFLSKILPPVAVILALILLLNPLQAPNNSQASPVRKDTLHIPFRGITRAQASDGTLDFLADGVLGQLDFTSTGAPNPPTDDSLNQPSGVAVHYMGRLFIADTANNRVLSWESVDTYNNGDPATLVLGQPNFTAIAAPNPPTAASLNRPIGVAVDFDGNLYVADTGNNRVLLFPALDWDEDDYPIYESGMAATVVLGQKDFTSNTANQGKSPGADGFNAPLGIAVDGQGNVAVADSQNHRVLMFEAPLEDGMAATGLIGQPNFQVVEEPLTPADSNMHTPSAVAVNMLENRLYVADTGFHRVLGYNRDTVFLDEAGALMIEGNADAVYGQPNFTTGSAPTSYSLNVLKSPVSLAVDSGDRLYVADAFHRVVVYPDPMKNSLPEAEVFGTGEGTSGASDQALNNPTGLATDIVIDSLFVADTSNNRVLEYYRPLPNAEPVLAKVYPASVRAGTSSVDVEVLGTGIADGSTVQVNGQTRQPEEIYVGLLVVRLSGPELAAPGTISISVTTPAPGGGTSNALTLTVFSPATGDAVADRVLGQRDFFTGDDPFFYPDAAGSLLFPSDVAIDPKTGRLFVGDWGSFRVLSWPNAQQFADGAPADLVLGQENLESFQVFTPTEGGEGVTNQSVDDPSGLAFDGQGNLYVADGYNNRILIFKPPFQTNMPAAKILGQADGLNQPASASTLRQPMGLAVDTQGNLYVADRGNCRVLIFFNPLDTDSVADRVLGQSDMVSAVMVGDTATAQNFRPYDVAVDKSGNVYVVDSHFSRILIFQNPLTSDSTADKVLGQPNFTASTSPLKASSTSMYFPSYISLDGQGNLYVSDLDYHRVLRFNRPLDLDTIADAVYGQPDFTSSSPNNSGINRTSLREPGGLTFDAQGNLFVVDTANNRVLQFEQGLRTYLPMLQKD